MKEWVEIEGTEKFEVFPLNDMKLYMRTAFFWVIMKRVVVIPYRRFGDHSIFILSFEDVADKLLRNIGSELRLLAA